MGNINWRRNRCIAIYCKDSVVIIGTRGFDIGICEMRFCTVIYYISITCIGGNRACFADKNDVVDICLTRNTIANLTNRETKIISTTSSGICKYTYVLNGSTSRIIIIISGTISPIFCVYCKCLLIPIGRLMKFVTFPIRCLIACQNTCPQIYAFR